MARRSSALGLVVLVLLASGCGQERTPAPDTTTPAVPRGTAQRSFPGAGVAFDAPANWTATPGQGSQIVTLASASAAVGVFRYPRIESLPNTARELGDATDSLVAAARARDATFRETSRRTTRIDGLRAVEIRGTGTILGRTKAIRSTHVYGRRGEVVVDSLAAPADFARLDAAVFGPLVHSLQISRAQG